MNPSYRRIGADLALLWLLTGVSCQEEYLPIEAAIEIPEAPKETLCSVKVHQVAPCLVCTSKVRAAGVHMRTAEERLHVHVFSIMRSSRCTPGPWSRGRWGYL